MSNSESHLCTLHGDVQGRNVVDGPCAEEPVNDHQGDAGDEARLCKCAWQSQHHLPDLQQIPKQSAPSVRYCMRLQLRNACARDLVGVSKLVRK